MLSACRNLSQWNLSILKVEPSVRINAVGKWYSVITAVLRAQSCWSDDIKLYAKTRTNTKSVSTHFIVNTACMECRLLNKLDYETVISFMRERNGTSLLSPFCAVSIHRNTKLPRALDRGEIYRNILPGARQEIKINWVCEVRRRAGFCRVRHS